jgi:hypothetical protein
MDMQTQALIFALGGLAVAVVAAAAGLRLLRIKAVFEYKLALADKELPWAASLYFVYGARTLHFSAGAFCLFALADLAQASNAWSMGASVTLGVLAVGGLGVCAMSMVSLAAIDFKVGISRFFARSFQMLAGLAGLGIAVMGLLVLVKQGYFWGPLN